MDLLETLITEPGTSDGLPGIPAPRAASPMPGNAQALLTLMSARETIVRLEAALRYGLTSHPGARRGGSDGNVADALRAIPKLAAGLDEDAEAAAARILERQIYLCQGCRDIDEAKKYRR